MHSYPHTVIHMSGQSSYILSKLKVSDHLTTDIGDQHFDLRT